MEIKDNEVQRLTINSRSEWGDRTYTIEKDLEYVDIVRNGEKERMLIVKPEIFPKFSKLITYDITAKKEENEVKVQNEDRLERLSKKGEISNELKDKMSQVINEMKKLWHLRTIII